MRGRTATFDTRILHCLFALLRLRFNQRIHKRKEFFTPECREPMQDFRVSESALNR